MWMNLPQKQFLMNPQPFFVDSELDSAQMDHIPTLG